MNDRLSVGLPSQKTIRLRRIFFRFLPTLVSLLVFAFFAGLWAGGAHKLYKSLLTVWGFIPYKFPFLDISASLAAWDCARQGVNVFVSDPCDVLHLPYNYSPLWVSIDWIPLGRSDRNVVGIIIDLAFLMSLAILPAPFSRSELAIRLLTTLSTMTCFAVERVNIDVLVFVIIVPAIVVLRYRFLGRFFGYSLVFLAGAIKYYPFSLLFLIFRETSGRALIFAAAATLAGILIFVGVYYVQIVETLQNIPSGSPFADFFGDRNLSKGIYALTYAATASVSIAWIVTVCATFLALLVLGKFFVGVWRRSDVVDSVRNIDEGRRLFLLAGGLLLVACFLLVQNITYRGIFILLIVPGLCALGRDESGGPFVRLARILSIAIVPLMWSTPLLQFVYHTVKFASRGMHDSLTLTVIGYFLAWLSREATWWVLICFLCLVIIGDFLNAPVIKALIRRIAQLCD